MTEIQDMADFDQRLQHSASVIFDFVSEKMGQNPWDRCYCEARSGPKDNGTVEVFRVILSRGGMDKSLAAPTEISKFIIRAFRARDRILTKKWYGLKINVFPDKRSTVEYNYDPNCLAEKNFIDVDFS